jgi:hypothetical protein
MDEAGRLRIPVGRMQELVEFLPVDLMGLRARFGTETSRPVTW